MTTHCRKLDDKAYFWLASRFFDQQPSGGGAIAPYRSAPVRRRPNSNGKGCNARRSVSLPHKTPKNEVFRGKWPLFGKISKVCSESFHELIDSRFVFKFDGNRLSGSGWKLWNEALYCWQKVRKMRLFRRHKGRATWHDPMSPCKISSQLVAICRHYSRNVMLYKNSIRYAWAAWAVTKVFCCSRRANCKRRRLTHNR